MITTCRVHGHIREHIAYLAVIPFGPKVSAGSSIDQLYADAHAIASAPDAAFQYITDAGRRHTAATIRVVVS